jgi:NAD(P)H-hydrate repair Nnr-like enzyme with NAD(P)H-hydrate epimerase domain
MAPASGVSVSVPDGADVETVDVAKKVVTADVTVVLS